MCFLTGVPSSGSLSEKKDSLRKVTDNVKWIPAVAEAEISKAQLLAGSMVGNLTSQLKFINQTTLVHCANWA
jgi:hypothetical protein